MSSTAVLPNPAALLAVLHVNALSVLLALLPLAVVAPAIRPGEGAHAVLLVLLVVTDVLSAIGPRKVPATFHFGIDPGAIVDATIGPGVHADAMQLVV